MDIEELKKKRQEYNTCKKCGSYEGHVLKNYDPIWGDGDIYCGQCGEYVRMFDRD